MRAAQLDTTDDALAPARVLALSRIVTGLMIAVSGDVHGALALSALDRRLATPPPALAWLAYLQLPHGLVVALIWSTVLLALLGALGVYTRAVFAALAGCLLVVLALPQRVGAVTHAHHLLWMASLLACAPCADVWSADQYFTPRPLAARASYLLPLTFMRALLAAVYFFPGLHKLLGFLHGVDPGDWFASHLNWKWLQRGHAAQLPFALTAPWLDALALGAVLFELSMPLLIAFRRTRPLALLAALSFHAATAWLLFIRFDSLLVLLVPLLDLERPGRPRPTLRGAPRALVAVAGLLLSGMLVTGLLGITQWYPVACYPTFAEPAPETMPSAEVLVIDRGARCALPRPANNHEWVQAFRIVGAYGDAPSAARSRAYVRGQLVRHAGRCAHGPDAQIELHALQLRWDFAQNRTRVVDTRLLYSASATALGMAPADGVNASSSPVR